MFSFEFNAPKYKCFGGNQPRRSTITAIDQNSSNDRWFLHFDRPTCWQELFNHIIDDKRKLQDEKTKNEKKLVPQIHQAQNVVQQQKQQLHATQKPQSNHHATAITHNNIHQVNKNQEQQSKAIAISSQRKEKIVTKILSKKQLPIKKLTLPKLEKPPSIVVPPQKKRSNDNDRHILPVKSLDSKQHEKPKVQRKPLQSSLNNQIKKSKSQPLLKKNKLIDQKKRNPPCLYPIRIQRQWQQAHNKKWYELTSPEIRQAENSMKKRIKQIENKKQEQKTRIKQSHAGENNGNRKREVRNPLYKSRNKKIVKNSNQDEQDI